MYTKTIHSTDHRRAHKVKNTVLNYLFDKNVNRLFNIRSLTWTSHVNGTFR